MRPIMAICPRVVAWVAWICNADALQILTNRDGSKSSCKSRRETSGFFLAAPADAAQNVTVDPNV
jgi:hypothetical protein